MKKDFSKNSTLYLPAIEWIHSQKKTMITLVQKWANINSFTENILGLEAMALEIKEASRILKGQWKEDKLKPIFKVDSQGNFKKKKLGKFLSLSKRPKAPIQILLGGHYDTVYSPENRVQKVKYDGKNTVEGPGVADMKGGLIVMLKAIEAFEKTPFCSLLGWEIFFNPDEEIGSLGSEFFLKKYARRHQLGLIFEPAFSDGSFVSSRKGSVNYTLIVKGKAAHVGRDFQLGCHAIYALAELISEMESLIDLKRGITVNIGKIEGGGPVNIIPDLASCLINIRAESLAEMDDVENSLRKIVKKSRKGITTSLHQESRRPPKSFDKITKSLFDQFKECGKELNIPLSWSPSGGVSDGNLLATFGLPVIDTLGVIGGNIHTSAEYLLVNSLTERAQLTAFFLMKLAQGKIFPLKSKG